MKSSLELFLLALIDSGLSTPYEFHSQAGISVGASLPALKSLLRQKLVSRGRAGNRRRMAYSLTRSGRAALRNWRATITSEQNSQDVASAVRSASVAYFLGSPAEAIRILGQASVLLRESAEPPMKLDLSCQAAAYRWIQSVRERHRRRADILALSEISKKMERYSG